MTGFTNHIHYSRELEEAVLGTCLLEKTAFGRVYKILNEEILYQEQTKLVYRSVESLYSRSLPIDFFTVLDDILVRQKTSEINGRNIPALLTGLSGCVVSSANIEYHSFILKRMWMEREVVRLTTGGVKLDGDLSERIVQLQTAIRNINTGEYVQDWKDSSELMIGLIRHQDDLEKNPDQAVKTGIPMLDEKNGGFFPGNLIVIGARPGVGKSAFMGQMALNMARSGKRVGIISLEMSNNEIAARIASIDTGIEFARIFRNLFSDENQKAKFLNRVSSVTSTLPFFVSDQAKVNAVDIRSKADKLKSHGGIDILFVDYLQLISADQAKNKTRENVISEISRSCKIMAKEMNIPVVILCQLNRESTKRTGDNRYPQLSDLRESGAIEQDADVVMFIHRDWIVGITQDEHGNTTEDKADLLVRKWRNAEPNLHLPLGFDGPRMQFKFHTNNLLSIRPEVDYTGDNPF